MNAKPVRRPSWEVVTLLGFEVLEDWLEHGDYRAPAYAEPSEEVVRTGVVRRCLGWQEEGTWREEGAWMVDPALRGRPRWARRRRWVEGRRGGKWEQAVGRYEGTLVPAREVTTRDYGLRQCLPYMCGRRVASKGGAA